MQKENLKSKGIKEQQKKEFKNKGKVIESNRKNTIKVDALRKDKKKLRISRKIQRHIGRKFQKQWCTGQIRNK